MSNNSILEKVYLDFSNTFDMEYENKAVSTRGEFLRSFPHNQLNKLTLDDYVIGKGTASFCSCVEAKTKAWANMQGANAFKFGIYFGKVKSDSTMKYRFTKKFGETEKEAFDNIKVALLGLISSGKHKRFKEIDDNPLSQMFKAKILSLYFPELYFNVCSAEHLEQLSLESGISEQQFVSQYQHQLVESKLSNWITKGWSNPKYMSYLYAKYMNDDLDVSLETTVKKPRKKARRKVNFEDITANRDAIGKISEEFAIQWEKNRLIGLELHDLVSKIEDRRDIPSYGYDYLSFTAPGRERYIEVKSVGRDHKNDCFRFYLSENEFTVSKMDGNFEDYYFYLVRYDKKGEPYNVFVRRAKELYENSEISSCAYIVRFDIDEGK